MLVECLTPQFCNLTCNFGGGVQTLWQKLEQTKSIGETKEKQLMKGDKIQPEKNFTARRTYAA